MSNTIRSVAHSTAKAVTSQTTVYEGDVPTCRVWAVATGIAGSIQIRTGAMRIRAAVLSGASSMPIVGLGKLKQGSYISRLWQFYSGRAGTLRCAGVWYTGVMQ